MSEKLATTAAAAPPAIKIETIMTSAVRHISPEMTVREAIMLLTSHEISGAPVVDNFGKVLSVCSEGDLLKLAATTGLDKSINSCLGKLATTEKLITLKKTATFSEAYVLFLTKHVHRIIITDSNGKLQGILSRSNILRVLCASDEGGGAADGSKAKPA